ncbi:YcfA-like protein [Kingella potus]|uniref:YcfA-like protein n=1 Tax=Kingella potus TaxID=265175 RepID=A0A377R1M8_9NEIS|nr:type II toxin-antitoxin system HicA family toxin [Kingella potus]UOP00511.1 type II toxin-antitoxin system HicA family toxin [Kingella potus]UOP02043.1 type II toxin-antitoxin system HicA family toxin [Kingella potus]STQ99868.1 YcfA-like protein [Kingella potus]STR02411.1 YcfA-like protein [Kingella potus]
MKSRELIAILEAGGWQLVRVKGSHHQFKKDGVPHLITISHPEKDVSLGQLKDAKKKSGLDF